MAKIDQDLDAIFAAGAADLTKGVPAPAPVPAAIPAAAPSPATPTATAASVAAGGIPAQRAAKPTVADLRKMAKELDVDPDLAESFFTQESGGNVDVGNSKKGAVGGMQVMPDTFKAMMGSYAGQRDPWRNMEAGLRYIAYGQKTLGTRDPELLAAGYHAGYDRADLKAGKIPNVSDGDKATPDYAREVATRAGVKSGRYVPITEAEAKKLNGEKDETEGGRYVPISEDEAKRLMAEQDAQPVVQPSGKGPAGVMTGASIKAPVNQSLAPVTPQFRAEVQRTFDAATPAQRQNMMQADDVVGQLAREMAGVQAGAPANPTAQLFDTTAEGRARRLAREGAAPQTAEAYGREGAQVGRVPGTELGAAAPGTFDFETQKTFANMPAVIRGAVKGYEGYKQGALGLAQAGAELVGANDAAETVQRGIKKSQGTAAAIGERGDNLTRNFEGAVSSIVQQLPGLFGGLGAGQAVPLAAMFTQTFGQEYGQTRAQGQDPQMAAARAGVMGAFEVLGEKFGLGNTLQAMKLAAKGAPTADVSSVLAKGLLKEIPGEQLTTLGQFLTDKVPGMGTNLEAGLAQYLQQAGDTLAQTVMQGGLMMGATTGVAAGMRHMQGAPTQQAQALAAEQARENALAKTANFWQNDPTAAPTPAAPAAPSGPLARAVAKGQPDAAPAPTTQTITGDDGTQYTMTSGPDGVTLEPVVEATQPVDSAAETPAETGTPAAEAAPLSSAEEVTAPTAPTEAKPKAVQPTNDARYQEAVDFVRNGGSISPRAIMTHQRIGFTAADRMVQRMAAEGVIEADDLGNWRLKDTNTPASEAAQPAPAKSEQAPVAPSQPPQKALADMTEPELRARMKYIAEQNKLNGGATKQSAAERQRVEAEIERRKKAAAAPAPAPAPAAVAAEEPAPEQTATGAYLKQSDANDAVRAAARATGQPHGVVEREEDGRTVFAVQPLEENDGVSGTGRSAGNDRADGRGLADRPAEQPAAAERQPGSPRDAGAQPAADAGSGDAAAPAGDAALNPHAGKWFGSKEKADGYIAKKKADGYEAVQTGKVRWEIKPKTAAPDAGKMTITPPPAAHVEAAKKADAEHKAKRPQPGEDGYTLTDARNDLIDLRTQAEAQGRVADDRLLSRIKRQEKLVADMEAAESGTPAAEAHPLQGELDAATDRYNAAVRARKAAMDADDAAGVKQATADADAARAEMQKVRGKVLLDGKAKIAEAGKARREEEAQAMRDMPDGTRLRPSEHAEGKGIYWEKTGADEWTGRGDWFQNGKTRTSAQMAESGGLVPMAPATGQHEKATAPEHVTGVDDRELGQIVAEFNAAQQAMVEGDEKVTHIFDAPAKGDIVRLADKAKIYQKDHGWMTPAEARKVIAGWKQNAAAQGKDPRTRSLNSEKIVLSFFDLSGEWSKPWEEAGYQVYRFDIQDDPDMGDVNNFSTEFFNDWFGSFEGQDVYAILAACPCTDFAVSGARHFAAKDADGRTVASVKLVHQTLAAIEYFKPPVWAVENPVGRIEKLGGLPPWRLSFDPNHLGDPYTKKTLIWGRFNGNLPIAPVEPTEGSKMHRLYGGKSMATKNARSVTPEGFSYGFFQANNAIDHPVLAVSGKYDRLDRDLIQQALDAGVTPEQIDNAVEDFYYMDLDDAAANDAIRDLIPEGGPKGGIANQSAATTIEGQEGAKHDGQATTGDADAGAAGQGAEAVQPHEGSGDAESVSEQPAGGDAGGHRDGTAKRNRRSGERAEPDLFSESAGSDAGTEQRAEGSGSGRAGAGAGDHRGAVSRIGDNYRIAPGELTRAGSWRDTAERNVEIVELVKRLEAENRRPTPEEAAKLVKYTGWGASEIANGIFPDKYGRYKTPAWQALGERLKAAMTPEEYAQAQRTTQYAHYTSEDVIRSIYDGLARLGFAGGKIAEPGMGIGHFAGLMPDSMAATSQYTGIEYDALTGAIARALYPQSNIIVGDFSKTPLPRNFFDLAIGNPPFSPTVVRNDPEYKKNGFMLHDYFFAKSIDRVKPGGLLVFVTSKGTMDKANDKARKYLAERANLLGAIRLPQTAFKDNAGTEVVTDVIFLQKKGPGVEDNGVKWNDTKQILIGADPVAINEYFAAHPEMVLGEHSTRGSMYRANEYTVEPHPGNILDHFAAAIRRLPENVYQPGATAPAASRAVALERDFNPLHKKEGGLYVADNGALMQVDNGSGVPVTSRRGADGKTIALKPKEIEFLKGWTGLRDALKQAQLDQLTDGNWEASLAALTRAYDAFTKTHGNLLAYSEITRTTKDAETGEEIQTVTKRFKNDPLLRLDVEGALAYSLEHIKENGDIVRAPVLSQRVLEKRRDPEIKTTQDALFVSLNNRGELDLDEVATLAGQSRADVITALGTAIYDAPGAGWQVADQYLSGNVRRKLQEAKEAAKGDPRYQRNVDALLAVQPKDLAPSEITVKLGQSWIPPKDIEQFASEALGETIRVRYNPTLNTWTADQQGNNQTEYNMAGMRAGDTLEAILNNRQIKVTMTVREDGKTKTVVNPEATEKANDIAKKISAAFGRWVWTDTARADRLVKYYNEHFNNIAPRKFDGSHLTLPGVSLRFNLYPHQKRAIWRMIQEGDTYLAHAVGAGKTFTMIAAGMEERRLGLSNKPMYVVPNHMLAQFAREFLELYPAANIMVADEQNFHTHNRKRFVAQAALNNPDAIVITHSAFGRIGMSDAYTAQFIQDQIAEWQDALADVDKNDRVTVKQVQRRIEMLERRLEAAQSEAKDRVLTFEELGVDRLFVDEAHEFRKLSFPTNQGNIKGIDPDGSQRAMDLFMKTQYLRSQKPGRALVMASGTPVTNTMGELYTVQRFFQPDQMAEDGMDSFDAWANQYGDVVAGFEQNAAGGYEVVSRFAKFQNVPELMRRVRSFMDILTSSNLGELVQRPDVAGGGREVVVTPEPRGYKAYQASLEKRIQAIRARKGPPKKGEDIILKVIADGRFSAIDMRFVDPTMPSDPASKLNVFIDRIIAAYNEGKDFEYSTNGKVDPIKGSSIIGFSDIGLGEQSAASRGFDMKAWIEKRLVEAGIPREHIAFMRDNKQHAKKERLFADMREGKRRILIGGKDMETGVNVQKRLTHLIHLDAPWFPASVEQREGRIVRQGNQNRVVSVVSLATKGSYDSTMWGMNGRKARFIEQAMNGDDSVRSLEDVSEASAFEMAAALASGDERYMRLAGLKADVERLERLAHAHQDDQRNLRMRKEMAEASNREARAEIKGIDRALKVRQPIKAGEFAATLNGKTFDSREDFSQAVFVTFSDLTATETQGSQVIGKLGGFDVMFHGYVLKGSGEYGAFVNLNLPNKKEGGDPLIAFPLDPDMAVGGIATRAVNQVNSLDRERDQQEAAIAAREKTIEQIDKRIGAPFPEQQEMLQKMADLQALETELASEKQAPVSADAALATVATEAGIAPAGLVEGAPNEPVEAATPRQSVVGPDAVMGTAATLLRDTLTTGEFGPLVQAMIDSGRLVLHETPASVPADTTRGVQAITLPDGTIHMVARNLDSRRAVPVLLHEMFHSGVRPLLGETQWKNLMVRLKALQNQATQSSGAMRKFWDAAFRRQSHAAAKGSNNAMHPEEFGAYAIEEYEKAPTAVKRWVDDVLGAIKAWLLRHVGMQAGQVTPAQLRALAVAALRRAGDTGTPAGEDIDTAPVAMQSVAGGQGGLTPPEPSRFEKLQAAVQDSMNRVRKVQDVIKEVSGATELFNADYYRAETNRPGRIAARLDDAKKQLTGPLMERLAKEGFKPEQLEELLHAQHAEERNQRIAAINKDMPDGGSGMTTAEANKILAKVPASSPLREMAQQARDIARKTLDLKLAYGLIDQETYDTLAKSYQHYVPLKGDGEYGPKIKRAMGHGEREEHILENIARDYDQAVVVGEKNLARQSLLALVTQHPDPDLWTVGVPPKGRYVAGQVYNVVDVGPGAPKNGRTVGSFNARSQVNAFLEGLGSHARHNYIVLDSNGDRVAEFNKPLQDNEVMVYVKGQPVRIQIYDETLAKQVRPLDTAKMHPILEFMRGMNRYLSKIYTGYNPAFILRNTARDAMTGTINMAGNEGAATAAKAWAKYPKALAALAQWAATGNVPAGKYGQMLNEYRREGGKTGASWMSDLEEQGKTLTRMYDDAYGASGYLKDGRAGKAAVIAGRKMVGGLAHVVEIANQATENALRLALYMTLREQGETTARAAQAAKNVTVDFDRKGATTPALGAIYLFLNPAIQGTANAMKTLAKGKHRGQAMAALGMLAGLGFFAASMGMGGDDDDRWLGEGWDTRTKNFILKIGNHTLRVPLSQEFAPAYAFGVALAEAMHGQSKMKTAARMVSSFLDAYFPLNGAFNPDSDNHGLDAALAATPTILRPGAELAANRNVFGGQIYPESDRTRSQPDNLKMFRGTKGSVYDVLAQQMAAAGGLTGARAYENDLTKVSPETLKYLWRTYTGGLGQFVTDSIGATGLAATDFGGMTSSDVPIVKDFWRSNDVKPIRGRYYDLAREAKTAADEFRAAKKAGDAEAMEKVLSRPEMGEMIALDRMVTRYGRAIAAVRDQAVEVNADKTLTTAQKRARLKEIEAQEEMLYRSAIDAFRKP